MADLTRREFIVGGLSLGALLAACGSPVNNNSRSTTGGGSPVTVEHKYGETTIPNRPSRVVTVGMVAHDPVLALGVVPVGITSGEYSDRQVHGVWPWAQESLGDAKPEVLSTEEVNFERIAGLRPDLILAIYSGITEPEYGKLSQIAPTVAQSGDHPNYGTPWDEMTLVIGRALGRAEEAQALVAGVKDRFARARELHPEFAGRTAIYAGVLDAGGYYTETAGSSRVGILTSMGFELSQDFPSDKFYVEIGPEQIDLFDRDVLLWEIGDAPGKRQAVEADALYQRLDVRTQGRDVFIEDPVLAGGLAFISVLSLPFVIDALVPMLAAAVDGDPATKVSSA
ncbi:MAG: iron-siderophore ABC transporter substrate-binding protein [Actinomycetota bacterium]